MAIKAQFPDEQSVEGSFTRQPDAFQDWVTSNGSSSYPAATGRYHLYVSWACPWAHRTIIVRKLKRLEDVIGMTVVDPIRDERGWAFREGPGHSLDPINGFQFLSQAYKATDPTYRGRFTVPVLWDKETKRIVSNSDDDLMRMFNGEFNRFTESSIDLYQEGIRKEIDDLNTFIYENVNNGVYRAGFATSQQAYERAVRRLFEALEQLEDRLARQRYLFGSQFVETDWRLFVTLVRFDAVYYRPFQVQSPANHRLPEPLRLSQRPLSDRRHRRHRELRPHQAALLHHPRRHQPDPYRPPWSRPGSDGPSWPRASPIT